MSNTHSLEDAAEISICSIQDLRCLLRERLLEGINTGQVWLIKMVSLDMYLRHGRMAQDRHYDPKRVIAEASKEVMLR